MRETIMRSLAAGVLLLVFQLTAFAQTTGSIKGTVTDPNGALLAGASVTSKNNATGIEQTVVTKDDGVFLFTALQPGTYTVIVENRGFKRSLAPDVAVVAECGDVGTEVGFVQDGCTVASAVVSPA